MHAMCHQMTDDYLLWLFIKAYKVGVRSVNNLTLFGPILFFLVFKLRTYVLVLVDVLMITLY